MPPDRISCQYEEEARETLRKREVVLVQQRRTVGREREIRRNNSRWCDETKKRTHSSSALGNWPHFPELNWRAVLGVEHE